MEKQNLYKQLRYILLAGSVVCLLFSLAFIQGSINDTQQEEFPEKPVTVTHRVLHLSSYDPMHFCYEPQKLGLEEGLYPAGIEYDSIFMDSINYSTAEDIASFHDFLKKRLASSKRNYEAVLVGDDAALNFVITNQKSLFDKLPIVFFGINSLELAQRASKMENITGFYEQNYLEETLILAMKLYPGIQKIVGMHDQTSAGKADFEIFSTFSKKYPDKNYLDFDVSSMTQSQMIEKLERLPEDSLVLYMSCYNDKWGNTYSVRSRTQTIAEHVHVPVFRNYVCHGNPGLLGGTYMDFTAQCNMAAHIVAEVLDGRDINTIPLHLQTPSHTVINWQLMQDLQLDFSKLPAETLFYNKPVTFYEHYASILPSVTLLILALLLLLAVAHTVTLTSRDAERELRESHDKLAKSQEELRYKAEYDEGLGILNRRTATERLGTMLGPDSTYSIVIIDIDSFKELNESFGHQVADSILQYLTAILSTLGGNKNWLLARYGGDEFLLMVPDETLNESHPIITKLMDQIRAPIPLGDETISMTASIGISTSDGVTLPDQHISNAETAMYEAKNRGKNGVFLYGSEMKERAREEMLIKQNLLEAFQSDGFYMLYQPQINAITQEVSGFEALVRMKMPGMYPGKFIPVAERNGWIWRIGRITTELAIKQLAEWKAQGRQLHPVSVNYSSNQLNDHGYVDFVKDLLERYDVPPHYLEIEITEGLFLEKSSLADQIFRRFKDLGIRLLMDDFGTGYSSLGYLSYIPVDVIKLDKSLVDAYLVTGKESFIRDVIQMMHDLGKEMIIEGVEEKWQFERLRDFGADTIQGYYFSKPITAEEAISFVVAEK